MSSDRPAPRTRLPQRLVLTFALGGSMLVLPTVSAPAAEPEPIAPAVQTLDIAGVDAAASTSAEAPRSTAARGAATDAPEVLTAQRDTDPFTVAGVSWPAEADVSTVQMRVRENGTWSAWESLPVIDEGPDAGTEEYERSSGRVGTSPLVSDGADGVQVRVDTADGTAPEGLELSLIDPGTSAADGSAPGRPPPWAPPTPQRRSRAS